MLEILARLIAAVGVVLFQAWSSKPSTSHPAKSARGWTRTVPSQDSGQSGSSWNRSLEARHEELTRKTINKGIKP